MKKKRFKPLQVEVGDDTNKAIKKFTRKVRDSEVLKEFVRKSRYEKPSEKKRRKRKLNEYLRSFDNKNLKKR